MGDSNFINTALLNCMVELDVQDYCNNNVDDSLLRVLNQEYSGQCSKYGYIIPNTIEIVSKPYVEFNPSNISEANCIFNTKVKCNTIDIKRNMTFKCKVVRKVNQKALHCVPVNEDLPLDMYTFEDISSINIDAIDIGDEVELKVLQQPNMSKGDRRLVCVGSIL